MDRISVPFWGIVLSHPLPVLALVGHYPTNKLIGRRPLFWWIVTSFTSSSGREIPKSKFQNPNKFQIIKYSKFQKIIRTLEILTLEID